jgi:hypothetical protein
MKNNQEKSIPVGQEFLKIVSRMEDDCEALTDGLMEEGMGMKAPKCLESLGTLLAKADAISSCFWNCPGPGYEAHTLQYLIGRAASSGRAALRLMRLGFYDEALSLVRSLGEIGNLFMLFHLSPSSITDWKSSDLQARRDRYQPGHIRKRIAKLGGMVPMDEAKYARLCELSTHPVPDLRPQLFNPHGVVTTGARFQEAGMLVVLNETAAMESIIVLLGAALCNVPEGARKSIRGDCRACVKVLGGISLMELPRIWEQLQQNDV